MQSLDVHRARVLCDIFDEAAARGFSLEENCCGMLLRTLGWPLCFCEGDQNKIKLVRQEDIAVFGAPLKR